MVILAILIDHSSFVAVVATTFVEFVGFAVGMVAAGQVSASSHLFD